MPVVPVSAGHRALRTPWRLRRLGAMLEGMEGEEQVTILLREAIGGDGEAQERLAGVVYGDLRQIAQRVRGGAAARSQDATVLVHEAWLRLVARGERRFDSRAHFFCVAARAMRGLVVDAARAASHRRADGDTRLALEPAPDAGPERLDVLDLDAALVGLQAKDPELARLVELRFFAGLSVPEAAETLGLSLSGAERRWRLARAWLHRQLDPEAGGER